MSDPFEPPVGSLQAVPQAAAEAGAALDAVRSAGASAADGIDAAFSRAGTSLARTLARAAADGKVSLGELARSAIEAVDAAFGRGGGGAAGGLAGALGALFGAAFAGARADGGPVTPGGAYLVGERGPELFRPLVAGAVAPAEAVPDAQAGPRVASAPSPMPTRSAAPAVPEADGRSAPPDAAADLPPAPTSLVVNLNLPSGVDAPALLRSEAQVAQALARAVALGRR